jgi:predicted short-subunit dehydrogenase-like oxidoreductase (DUF2520 family)
MTGSRPSLAFIGAGRVAGAFAPALAQAGYQVVAICSRSHSHAQTLASRCGASVVAAPAEAAAMADLTLLTVPDSTIAQVVSALDGAPLKGKAVIHTAGSLSRSILDPLLANGALVGSLHPAIAFASSGESTSLNGAAYALEAEGLLRCWLEDLVTALGGLAVHVDGVNKMQYHAALAIVSNYTVTLYAISSRLLAEIGFSMEQSRAVLLPLLTSTLHSLTLHDLPMALTGPVARGDISTVAGHIARLTTSDTGSDILRLYRLLARLTLPIAAAQGLPADRLTAIANLLQDGDDAEHSA